MAVPVLAAFEVVISVSPTEAVAGQRVEVLVRTFVPADGAAIDLPSPSFSYPAPSGMWDVLYPIADYPFQAIAAAADGTTINIRLARDPGDPTLWRGSFSPTEVGAWTISLPQWQRSATVHVSASQATPSEPSAPLALAALLLLGVGLIVGYALGHRRRRAGS